MQWHTKHSSKTRMSLLKCLHVMDENVTHPFSHLEPSLTPSRMHMPSVRSTVFKTKVFVFENTLVNSDKILLDNPPNKYVGQSSEVNCWTTLRNSSLDILQRELLDNFPIQFFRQLSDIIFFLTILRFSFVCGHTPIINCEPTLRKHIMRSHLLFKGALVHMKCNMPLHNNSC